jgi:hypothetical protein
MTGIDIAEDPPRSTLAGFNLGMRLALPVIPGMFAFGLAVGPPRRARDSRSSTIS